MPRLEAQFFGKTSTIDAEKSEDPRAKAPSKAQYFVEGQCKTSVCALAHRMRLDRYLSVFGTLGPEDKDEPKANLCSRF